MPLDETQAPRVYRHHFPSTYSDEDARRASELLDTAAERYREQHERERVSFKQRAAEHIDAALAQMRKQ